MLLPDMNGSPQLSQAALRTGFGCEQAGQIFLPKVAPLPPAVLSPSAAASMAGLDLVALWVPRHTPQCHSSSACASATEIPACVTSSEPNLRLGHRLKARARAQAPVNQREQQPRRERHPDADKACASYLYGGVPRVAGVAAQIEHRQLGAGVAGARAAAVLNDARRLVLPEARGAAAGRGGGRG